MNAAKDTLKSDGAWSLLEGADKIYVTSGKKIIEFDPASADKEEILKRATGRTGNLRAPALRKGGTYYIGYNEELYETYIKK